MCYYRDMNLPLFIRFLSFTEQRGLLASRKLKGYDTRLYDSTLYTFTQTLFRNNFPF